MPRLSYLMTLTPLETWRLLRRRLPALRNGPVWTAGELLSSGKHSRGIRFAELLLRQEAIVRRHMPWEPLEFAGKRVVEIGCGPLGGFGPLAVFCGASAFESAEPEWDADLFSSDRVREQYLRVFHADLTALFGPRMDFDEFTGALSRRMTIHRTSFERMPANGVADIVLSQSCLEHVFPLVATIEKLAAVQNSQTRFLHLVDFGNHYPTADSFEGLYRQPPQEYIARRGKAINLLRAPDVAKLFADFGIAARLIPSRVTSGNHAGTIHPWWRERYDDATLFTQLALVAGPVS
jgi:hypothetical protein